jgi:hypothetical protein
MKIKLLLISLFILFYQLGISHPGGHGHQDAHSTYSQDNIRTWHFADESIAAKGYFMSSKNGNVVIETKESIKRLSINQLSKVDQHYLQQKSQYIQALNSTTNTLSSQKIISTWNPKGVFFFLLYGLLGLVLSFGAYKTFTQSPKVAYKNPLAFSLFGAALFSMAACTEIEVVNDNVIVTSDPAIIAQAFAAQTNVSTRSDSDYFYVESNGIPDHEMMAGITTWIDQVPTQHDYTGASAWQIPLKTQYATKVLTIEDHFHRGAIAIAVNGIPIFNPYNASNAISQQIGELDQYGGHAGRGDDYHYHVAPLHLETAANLPIAYALDGYPVYGSTEPDGSAMNPLDSYHGHEHSDGTYHYHGTVDFPYMIAAMRGVVTMNGYAPEDEITPQPVGASFRNPLRGITNINDNLLINSCDSLGTNGYILRYTLNGLAGDVEYSWDNNNLHTFIFHDTDGQTVTEQHQK